MTIKIKQGRNGNFKISGMDEKSLDLIVALCSHIRLGQSNELSQLAFAVLNAYETAFPDNDIPHSDLVVSFDDDGDAVIEDVFIESIDEHN